MNDQQPATTHDSRQEANRQLKSDFKDRLHLAMNQLNWPQRGRVTALLKLLTARGIDISLPAVHKWFRGISMPRRDLIPGIAKVLCVEPDWLEFGDKEHIEQPGYTENRLIQTIGDLPEAKKHALLDLVQMLCSDVHTPSDIAALKAMAIHIGAARSGS